MQLFAVNFISLQGHSTCFGCFHTLHQEYIKLYLQPPVQVILLLQLPSSKVALTNKLSSSTPRN